MPRSFARAAIAAALLLGLSCATAPTPSPAPSPPRAPAPARTEAPKVPAVPQWKHDWARGAVFYEIDVRDFATDFKGLISKLDYLSDFGIGAISLVDTDYSADPDFKTFLAEAHKRRIRVVVELPSDLNVETARQWLGEGVDGFRIVLPPGAEEEATHQRLKEFSAAVRKSHPEAVLVGETNVETRKLATYFGATKDVTGGDELPLNLNVPLAAALVEGMKNGSSYAARKILFDMWDFYPKTVIDAPFLTNREQARIATVVGNHPGKLRNSAAILLTLQGAPFMHFGEEVGLESGPMSWSAQAAQASDPKSLLSYYRTWIAARKGSHALSKGWFQPLDISVRILAYMRYSPDESVIVVHNIHDAPFNVALPVGATEVEPVQLDPGVGVPNTDLGSWTVMMPPYSSAVWRVK